MAMMELVVPPGAPTVDSAGPAFPAELTKMTLCLLTTCSHRIVITNLAATGNDCNRQGSYQLFCSAHEVH